MLEIILLLLGFFLLDKKSILSLINVYSLYIIVSSIRLMYYRYTYSYSDINIVNVDKVSFVLIIFTIVLLIGYNFFSRVKLPVFKLKKVRLNNNVINFVSYTSLIIGLVLWLMAITSIGTNLFNIIGSSERYLKHLPTWHVIGMNFAISGLLLYSFKISSKKEFWKIFILSFPFILMGLVLTRRSLLIPIISIPVIFLIINNIKKINAKHMIVLVLGLFFISLSLQSLRYYYGYGLFDTANNPYISSIDRAFDRHLAEVDPLLYLIQEESIVNSQEWSFASWYAWTYQIIPSFFVENKPTHIVIGKHVAHNYFGSNDLSHGRPPTLIGTFYLNLGIVGVVIGGFVISFLISYLEEFRKKIDPGSLESILYFIFWFSFGYLLTRLGDFSAAVVQSVSLFLPTFLLLSVVFVLNSLNKKI